MNGWWLVPTWITVVATLYASTRILWCELAKRLFVPAGAAQAIRICCETFGVPIPRVYWIRTAEGWYRSLWGGRKVAGETPHPGAVNVAWRDGMLFSESALAHEIGHVWLLLRGSGYDYDHTDPIFAPGGTVELCRKRLLETEVTV